MVSCGGEECCGNRAVHNCVNTPMGVKFPASAEFDSLYTHR
jgi:hypothetical protein